MKVLVVIAAALVVSTLATGVTAQSYRDEIARAREVSFTEDGIRVSVIDLGPAGRGDNRLAVTVANQSSQPRRLVLGWTADAGLSQGMDEGSVSFVLEPDQERTITGEYGFHRLSPFANLLVTVSPAGTDGRVASPLFSDRFRVGPGNPGLLYDRSAFELISGPHVNLFFFAGSPAAEDSWQVLEHREEAIRQLERLVDVKLSGGVDLYLYPDEARKVADTGHRGAGWAFGRTMVEVYNEDIKLDPYHEFAHILVGTIGSPPAILDEGFAVFATEHLGGDALRYLGAPGRTVDQVSAANLAAGTLIALEDLFDDTDFGNDPKRAVIAYPQAASFVRFLWTRYGGEVLRELLTRTTSSADPAVVTANRELLERLTGSSFDELEAAWHAGLQE